MIDVLEEEIRLGTAAKAMADSEVFQTLVAKTDAKFVEEWRQANTPALREAAHAKQAALHALVQAFTAASENADFARSRLAAETRKQDAENAARAARSRR